MAHNSKSEVNLVIQLIRVCNVLIFLSIVFLFGLCRSYGTDFRLPQEKYIAHAGGEIRGSKYTNSLEAIELSYGKGFRFIELDFEWTTDNEVVLIHDWKQMRRLFEKANKIYSLKEFMQLEMKNNLTQLSLDDLVNWLKSHPNVYIVTDIKSKNIEALKIIASKYGEVMHQFIPQIYSFEEYKPVSDMGYSNIILTLYLTNYPDNKIIKFCKNNRLLAVTMPNMRGLTGLPEALAKNNVFVYSHTVNDDQLAKELTLKKVNGFYTHILGP